MAEGRQHRDKRWVSAQINERIEAQLDEITYQEDLTRSEVVRRGVALYYRLRDIFNNFQEYGEMGGTILENESPDRFGPTNGGNSP